MIGFLALVLAIVVPMGIGWGLLWLAVPPVRRREPLEQVFLGGFVGLVLLTAQLFVYSLLDIRSSFWVIVAPWVVVLGVAGVAHALGRQASHTRLKRSGRKIRAPQRTRWRFSWPRLNVVDAVLLVVLAAELFWIVTMTVNELVWGWDTMVNWARKAKIFYFEARPDYGALPLPAYPLCVPLAQTWVFHCLGTWNDAVGKGIFVLPFVLGGCGFYTVLKSLTHRTWALAATAALLATPRIFLNLTEGYADAFLALLYGPGVLLLCRWLVRSDRWDLWAGALCLGMTAWIKAEGLPLGFIALALAFGIRWIARRRWLRDLTVTALIVLVLALGVTMVVWRLWLALGLLTALALALAVRGIARRRASRRLAVTVLVVLALGLAVLLVVQGRWLALALLAALVIGHGVCEIVRYQWWRDLALTPFVALVLVLLAGIAWQVVVHKLELGAVHGEGVYSFENFRKQLTAERVSVIGTHFWHEIRLFRFWGIVWFVWPVAALASVRRLVRPASALLLTAILADLLLILVIFVTTKMNLDWHLSAALERLMINVVPLLFALVTVQAYGFFQGAPTSRPAE